MVAAAVRTYGRIDVMINNAGLMPQSPLERLKIEEWDRTIDVNIRRLRDNGVPVILITHTLPDVFAVADRLMVMHRGRKVTEKKTVETSTPELVQYMVGALDDTR